MRNSGLEDSGLHFAAEAVVTTDVRTASKNVSLSLLFMTMLKQVFGTDGVCTVLTFASVGMPTGGLAGAGCSTKEGVTGIILRRLLCERSGVSRNS